ncbi:MAG TPA: hypothetical protein VN605_04525, partial [Thermoanaerobaculia bacterium]|nr:hypothetical protein [Thermoanaerobaculia bacterium]
MQPLANDVFRATIIAPDVDGSEAVPATLTIGAVDYDNNAAAAPAVTLNVTAVIDPNAPQLAWLCGSPGILAPAGYTLPLRLFAQGTASNPVASVTIAVDGQTYTATQTAATTFEISWQVPPSALAEKTYPLLVTATSLGGNKSTVTSTITVVAGTVVTTTTSINESSMVDGESYIVEAGGNLTITGTHHLADLVLLGNAVVTQLHTDLANPATLSVRRLYVGCGATIDVTRAGYPATETYPGVSVPGQSGGGSHIGRGAQRELLFGPAFGSVEHPLEAGGGGWRMDNDVRDFGGGVIRVDASSSIAIDGTIRANGGDNSTSTGGAGGSVYLSTRGAIAGGGTIEAIGGATNSSWQGTGAGGAIALEGSTLSGALLQHLSAAAGAAEPFMSVASGAGSIYLKRADAPFGDLVVDNGGRVTAPTELPALGLADIAAVSGNTLTLSSKYVAPYLTGHWVRLFAPDGSVRGTARIAAVQNASSVRTLNGYTTISTQDAVAYSGYIAYLDAGVSIGGETRHFVALRFSGGTWQLDNDSSFVPFT